MRKKAKILCLLAILACSAAFVGCKDDNKKKDPAPNSEQIVVSGEGGAQADKYEIQGAQDIHIAKTVTELSSYTEKVQAVGGATVAAVVVDDSAVQYGVKGEYTLTYSYGEESKAVKVFIYDTPTISVQADARTQYAYAEYYAGVTHGISAVDCFGGALDIRLFDHKNAENADGSLNAGTYTMTFAAVDKAGQIVYVDKAVTIAAGTLSAIESAYTYDVATDSLVITLAEGDYDGYIALSLGGEVLPAAAVTKGEGGLVISGDYLYSACPVNVPVSLRLLTSKGFADSQFTLTDNGIVAYDDSAILDFVLSAYECGVATEIPQITLTNERQSVVPVYTVKKGNEVVASSRTVNFTTDGTHTLEITLRDGQVLTYDMQAFYNLGYISGKAYLDSVGMDSQINTEKYTLTGYTVYDYLGVEQLSYSVAEDTDGSQWTAFNTAFKGLSKKQAYTMKASGTLKGTDTVVSQTVDFTLMGSGTTDILTDSKDGAEQNMYAKDGSTTELKYVSTPVGGRVGAYKWIASKAGNNTATMLGFNEKFSSQMKKDSYLSFDIYAEKPISLTWAGKTTHYLYNSVSGFTNAKLYDAGGNVISSGSFWGGSFKEQWVTVEIQLDEDFIFSSSWRGLTITSSGLYGNNVYLANVKISSQSFLQSSSTSEPDEPIDPTQTSYVILADEGDAGNMYANNSELTSLTYSLTGIGGRGGVFKWSTTSETAISSTDAMLRFANTSNTSAWLTTGKYLSFDFYAAAPVTPAWFGSNTTTYLYSSVSGLENVTFYNEQGTEIESGSIWNGDFNGQWITIEIYLDVLDDYLFTSPYRGLGIWAGGFTKANPIYIDDVTVSTTSIADNE